MGATWLQKGFKVAVKRFGPTDVVARTIVGTITHVHDARPTTEVRIRVKPDDGSDEVEVGPEWITQVVPRK